MAIPYRNTRKKVITPDQSVREAWVMQQVSYDPIPFETFVKECVMSQGVSSSQMKGIADAMSNRLQHYLELGHSVQIAGIGTLKPTFNAKCADTPEELGCERVRQVKVQFYPHKEFKKVLRKMEFVNLEEINENPE